MPLTLARPLPAILSRARLALPPSFLPDVDRTKSLPTEPIDGQRHFTRVSLHNPAIIATGDTQWDTHLMDLSLSGALLEQPSGWTGKTGDRMRLKLQLADQSYLEVDAQIRQIDANRLGMSFIDLDDSDRDEIRWLVEINLGDAEMLGRELSAMISDI